LQIVSSSFFSFFWKLILVMLEPLLFPIDSKIRFFLTWCQTYRLIWEELIASSQCSNVECQWWGPSHFSLPDPLFSVGSVQSFIIIIILAVGFS
jgi:hypothetical protein